MGDIHPPTDHDTGSHTMNLSNYTLLPEDNTLLSLGLSFIPTVPKLHIDTIRKSLGRLIRAIKLKDFFGDDCSSSPPPFDRLFINKSEWMPPSEEISKYTKELIKNLRSTTEKTILKYHFKNDHFITKNLTPNITRSQRLAIPRLRNHPDLILKRADKGGLTCLLNRSSYLTEAYRQLDNTKYYERITTPRRLDIIPKINSTLSTLLEEDFINANQFEFLEAKIEDENRYFYLLPKVHKDPSTWPQTQMPAGRPIVGDCSTESRRISDYVDHFLKPISTKHASYIKDSYDFVARIRNKKIYKDALLVTGDITSLYTNMNINRTIAVAKRALAKYPVPGRPDKYIIELLELALRNNDFHFNEEIFLQIYGTAMGKSFAPSLANLYLVDFDNQAMKGFHIQPQLFFRFLDDVFFVWPGTREDLKEFERFLNSIIPDIEITLNVHDTEVNFLDTSIFKHHSEDTVSLQTKVFFKATDTHQLLHTTSFHPPHTCPGILKSQIIRFQRLSSFKTDFDHTCRILFNILQHRGYNKRLLRRSKFEIWHNLNRRKTPPTRQPILPIVIPYSPISTHLIKEWKKILAPTPLFHNHRIIAAYSKHRNLSQLLTSSKLRPT